MNSETVLDHIIFQLTPTRTRCEVFVVVGDVTQRLTAGLLKPFLSHLQAAEEQLATGGYSIKLGPPDHRKSSWFTKGTAERFVRFVSTPQVLERVHTIEMELVQLEETIRMQTLTTARIENPILVDSPISVLGNKVITSDDKPRPLEKMREDVSDRKDFGVGKSTSSKKQLLKALDARRLVLQKEQGMAFARAAAAGFELGHVLQLIVFSDCFGAARLREACLNYVAMCNKRQVAGFGSGEAKLKDEDLLWAFSSPACTTILMALKGSDDCTAMVDGEPRLQESMLSTHLEHFNTEKDNRSVQVNSSPASYQWSNTTDSSPGWPVIQPNRGNTFVSYQHGFSPVRPQSFNALSDLSPPDVTGRFQPFMGAYGQLPPEIRPDIRVLSSYKMLPLQKLQVAHGGVQHVSRNDGRRPKHQVRTHYMLDMASGEATDSLVEMAKSLEGPSLIRQQQHIELKGKRKVEKMKSKQNRKCYKSSDSQDSSSENSFQATSSVESVITRRQNMEMASLEQSFFPHQCRDGDSERFVQTNLQVSNRVVTSDESLVLFEQERDGGLGNRMKKRLDFREAEAPVKQEAQTREHVDDSFFAHSFPRELEESTKPRMISESKSHQIYDMMSKKALKVNSVVSHRQDPDDLQMLPRQRQRLSTAIPGDVMKADIELSKNAKTNVHKASMAPLERSQERVRKFLDQYNEKREAKLREVAGSSQRAEREGKLKTMQEVLEKRKLEIGRSRRLEKTNLQAEAQLRADKVRAYKAGLQKSKKEKEDEERKRLEELKAKRQERITARSSNPGSTSRMAARSNSSLSLGTAAHTKPNSLSSVRQKMSLQPMLSSSSKLSPIQRGRPSLLNSAQGATKTAERKLIGNQPTPHRSALLRSSAPSVSELRRQAGRAYSLHTRSGSSSLPKSNVLKSPLRTDSPSGKNYKLILGVAGKRGRDGNICSSSPRNGSKQGVISRVRPSNEKGPSLKKSFETPPLNARKEMLRRSVETSSVARTFLKKGSGPGSLGKIVQRPRGGSPVKLSTVECRHPLSRGTRVEGVNGSARLNIKDSSIPNDGFVPLEVVGPGLLEVVGRMDNTRADESAHSDMRQSMPNHSHNAEVAIPLSIQHEPSNATRISNVPLSSQVPVQSLGSCKGPPLDSQMSRLTVFDEFCRLNGKSAEQSDNLASTPNGISLETLRASTLALSAQPPGKEQVKGLKSLLKFGQRSSQDPASVASERDGVGSTGSVGLSGNHAVHAVSKGMNGSRHAPGKPLKAVGSDSSASKGATAKVSQRFSFLGSLRSKVSETKWH